MDNPVPEIQKRVAEKREWIIEFMRDICAIPSLDSQIGQVGALIGKKLKFAK